MHIHIFTLTDVHFFPKCPHQYSKLLHLFRVHYRCVIYYNTDNIYYLTCSLGLQFKHTFLEQVWWVIIIE